MTVTTLLLLVAGLVLLVVGADLLVRGASRLAVLAGVSPLVIGLTVVAYGTSAPELAVSLKAAFAGQADLALGNVIGSNIFNVLVILGVSALVTPLIVDQQIVRRDAPIMVGISLLVLAMALDGRLGRADGILLLAGAIGFTLWTVRASREESRQVREEYEAAFGAKELGAAGINVLLVLVGLGLLVLGSRWLVTGAVAMARHFGVSELVIGLTIVAAGTSLPEVATSVVASFKRQVDIAVGNVIGSNIFNLLLVLGASAAIGPDGVPVAPAALAFDLPVMVAVAVACLPIFFVGHRISRWDGLLFIGYFIAWLAWVVLKALGHDSLHGFTTVMLWFVMPLTLLTLLLLTWRQMAEHRRAGRGLFGGSGTPQ